MKLCTAKQIQVEAHRLVAAVERDDPAPLIGASLMSIVTMCQAAAFANAFPIFFRSPGNTTGEQKPKGNSK